MPFLKLGWDLKKGAAKDALGRVVLNAGEPKVRKAVLATTLGFVWVAKAELGTVECIAATLNVFDELRECCCGAVVRGLKL
jgi:hypothetical protein